MEIFDINSLTRDENQSNLYDLFIKTYRENENGQKQSYIVKDDEMMRIDLISQSIYESTEYVDFLLNFNYINNPLNIMGGDEIFYMPIEVINNFRNTETSQVAARRKFTNANKGTRKDPTRQQFLEKGFTLPPNFLDVPQTPVRIDGNSVVIG